MTGSRKPVSCLYSTDKLTLKAPQVLTRVTGAEPDSSSPTGGWFLGMGYHLFALRLDKMVSELPRILKIKAAIEHRRKLQF
jgi:hypothetical protein